MKAEHREESAKTEGGQSMRKAQKIAALFVGAVVALACASSWADSHIDRRGAQASTEVSESAKVPELTIPYDPSAPKYVVIFDNFENATSGSDVTSGTGAPTAPKPRGSFWNIRRSGGGRTSQYTRTSTELSDGTLNGTPTSTHGELSDAISVRAMEQFSTALSRWPNISVADNAVVKQNDDGTLTTKMDEGEVGPFLIRGTVTEFNETSDLDTKNSRFSGGAIGNVISILAPRSPLGNLTATINPEVKNEKQVRKGAVAVDVKIIDARRGRQVAAFTCEGKFESQSATSGLSILGSGGGQAEFAASTLGQATRAAANDCLRQAVDALKTIPGK